ncbi:MAG: hypothetical protein JWM75_2706, partial [Sphingomonas bacterium]|nr:hypothetical protein [Sphingomonas bacterium]
GWWERLHWGLGTHLGQGAIQGPAGDWVAHVHKDENNPTGRGTLTDVELRPHTDFHEIMSLGAVSRPISGGASALVSATAIRDAIAAERPELLAALYEGYYYGINEAVGGEQPLSAAKVPLFSEQDGRLSCLCNGYFMATGAKRRGESLPAELVEALACFNEVAMRDDIVLRFMLAPGEIVFWHNWTLLHARESFVDAPGSKRLLTRLWINVPGGRAVHPEIAERARLFDRDHHRAAELPPPA